MKTAVITGGSDGLGKSLAKRLASGHKAIVLARNEATLWGNVKTVYFGAYASDVAGNGYEYKYFSSEKLAENSQLWDGGKIEVVGGILHDECRALLKDYKNWMKQE